MNKLIKKTLESERQLIVQPSTLNDVDRSVQATVCTITPCLRYYDYELVDEVLVMSKSAEINIPSSVPLIDTHNASSIRNILGSVINLTRSEAEVSGTVTISKSEESTWTKLSEGHINSLSVGAVVKGYYYIKKDSSFTLDDIEYKAVDRPMILAVKWQINEVSLVAKPADANCVTRQSINQLEEKMSEVKETVVEDVKVEQAIDVESIRNEAVKAEKERIAEIYVSCRNLKLGDEFAEKLINDNTKIDVARKLIIEKGSETMRDVKNSDVKITKDSKESIREGLNLVSKRMFTKLDKDEAADLAKSELNSCRSAMSIARALLENEGIKTFSMSNEDVYSSLRAYGIVDFSSILQSGGSAVIVDAFEKVAPTCRIWTGEQDLSTFNTYDNASLTPVSGLDVVAELATLPALKMAEAKESVKLQTRAGVVTLSREAIISDNLGAFKNMMVALGELAARAEEKAVYAKLAVLDFTADAITPAALSMDALEILNVLLMNRTVDVDGVNEEIGAPAKFLLVPSALRRVAHEICKSPTYSNGIVNSFTDIEPIATPYISGTKWFAAGNRGRTINRFYLNGNQQPILEQFDSRGADALGISFRVIYDFAVGVVNKAYIAKNAGV